MPVALRGSAAVPTGNPTTSFSVTIDAAVQANDLLFLTATSRDNLNPVLGPSISDNDTGGNSWAVLSQTSDGKATIWWKRATSGSASKTVTVSNCIGSASGVLKAFSGGDTGATPYTNVVSESNASGNETHADFTPDQADSMLCAAVFNYNNDNAVTSLTFATAGATTMTEKQSTGGSDSACAFGHVLQSGGPSATGSLTWSQTDGTTYSITWAIKPAVNNYTLTADPGSYAVAGTAASLLLGYLVAADPGSFSVAGTAASLLKASVVVADAGAFSVSGVDASLLKASILSAQGGAYSVTGVEVTFSKGYPLVADSGTFTLSGTTAGLRADRRFTAESSALALAGVAAQLYSVRLLGAEAATFSVAGSPSSLLRAAVLGAAPGAYTLTFMDADLEYSSSAPVPFVQFQPPVAVQVSQPQLYVSAPGAPATPSSSSPPAFPSQSGSTGVAYPDD